MAEIRRFGWEFPQKQPKQEWTERLSLKLLRLHQGDQIMIATYRNTSLSSPSSCSELDPQFSVRPCEAEEVDQCLVRHTLNLISNSYKNTLIRLIDIDVLVLLILYIGQVQLNDNRNSCMPHKLRQVLQHQTSYENLVLIFSCFTLLLCFYWMWYCFQFLW